MSQNDLIGQLQEAAKDKDMYRCQQIVRRLLLALDPHNVLQIALKKVETYFPVFDTLHPENFWVRNWIVLALRFEPIDYSIHSFGMFVDFYDDFASTAYIHAIQSLDGSLRGYFREDTEITLNLAADAIESMATAKLFTHLRATASPLWLSYERILQTPNMVSQEEEFKVAKEFMESSERKVFIERFYTDLSIEIAKAGSDKDNLSD